MIWTARHFVAVIALVALTAGVARIHPCMNEASCPSTCDTQAAATCSSPDGGHEHKPQALGCDCLCHVPVVAGPITDGPVRGAPALTELEPSFDSLRPGFPHPPFRPPNT